MKSRRIYIWFLSLLAVFSIYLLYGQLTQTPDIKIDTGREFEKAIAESNAGQFEGGIGKVGEIGVGTVHVARFMDFNKDKSVSREFGFEKLLHEDGPLWEIEKPYMNVFRPDLKCYFTADRGDVHVETAGVTTRPTPKDAKLMGNVTIHIMPKNKKGISESYIYLDDVSYASEKSQFSTEGPVKFISEDALMLGKGFELVYNNEDEQVEYLKINNLDSLRLRNAAKSSFVSPEQKKADSSPEVNNEVKAKSTVGISEANVAPVKKRKSQNYRIVLNKNVLINTPEQVILADEISLNNVLLSSGTGGESAKGRAAVEDAASDRNNAVIAATDMTAKSDKVVSKDSEPNELSVQFDIVVTCDNGIFFAPMDFPRMYGSTAASQSEAQSKADKSSADINDVRGRARFIAKKIEYDVPTGNTVAIGPSEITFYPKDMMGEKNQQNPVPVTITAQEKTEFLRGLNQVNFEGDCQFTMIREDAGTQQKYTLSAPKISVNLAASKDRQSSDLAPGIEHLTAMGGTVQLALVRQAGEKILGFTKLRCLQFDYDAKRQVFIASKGLIAIDNSKVAEPPRRGDTDKFSLQKPCYAFLRDFDTMEYSLKTNKIVANAEPNGILLIDYIPIAGSKEGEAIKASAGNIEASLAKTETGQSKLLRLNAIDGVTYEEENKNSGANGKAVQFVGSQFIYDANESKIKAWGSGEQPCLFNNVLADGLDYDLKTGRVKIGKIVGGSLQFQ